MRTINIIPPNVMIEAIKRADENLANPLIDKSKINVVNYYSAMVAYMAAMETEDAKLINTSQKNLRDTLNGDDVHLNSESNFQTTKNKVTEFLEQQAEEYYEVIPNPGACDTCVELSLKGKMSEIGNALLPPYHPNCKCKIVVNGNSVESTVKSNNIPWYQWLSNEFSDKTEDYIQKISKGNIGGGLLNLLGATLNTPQSLYLRTH